MNQYRTATANYDMTEAELDVFFQQLLDERTPLDTAALSTPDLEARVADLRPAVTGGPSLMDYAIELGALYCSDAKAVVRSATHFVSLLIARAYAPAGAA